MPWHLMSSEPLTVAGFVSAIQRSSPGSLVLDVGAQRRHLFAARRCSEQEASARGGGGRRHAATLLVTVRRHLELNQLSTAGAHGIRGRWSARRTHRRPHRRLRGDGEPLGRRGRFPNGRLRKKNLALDRRTLQPVSPLHLGEHIGSLAVDPMALIAATKIDTEGFETRVPESLRRCGLGWATCCSSCSPRRGAITT